MIARAMDTCGVVAWHAGGDAVAFGLGPVPAADDVGAYVGVLSRVADVLSAVLGVVPPLFAIEENHAVNAMLVTPRDGVSVLVLSTGLLDRLRPDEAAAVVAHELAHLAYGDPGFPVGAPGPASFWKRAAGQVRARIWALGNRRREYRADALAAELVGVDALLGALGKSGDGGADRWFDTHPSPSARIARLQRLRQRTRVGAGNQAGLRAFHSRGKPRHGQR